MMGAAEQKKLFVASFDSLVERFAKKGTSFTEEEALKNSGERFALFMQHLGQG